MSASKSHEPSVIESVGERAKSYVDSGVDTCSAVSEKARKMGQNADGYVRKNPWVAIGIATGVGMMMGLMLGRRR